MRTRNTPGGVERSCIWAAGQVRVAYVPFHVSGHALKVVGREDRWAR